MLHEALQVIHNNSVHQARKAKQRANSTKKMQESAQNLTRSMPQFSTMSFGSSVAIHKLRESKWFGLNECKILLSVVESGFILEKRMEKDCEEREWGIALWEPGQEKSKNIQKLNVCCLSEEKDKKKVKVTNLEKFWLSGNEIRINNQQDKEKLPNNEEEIRKQIEYAIKVKNMKWHNKHHFVYWCRYEKPMTGRIQQISDRVRWNSIGVNLGMLIGHRTRKTTTST